MLVLGLGLVFMGLVRLRCWIGPGAQPAPNIGGGHKSSPY